MITATVHLYDANGSGISTIGTLTIINDETGNSSSGNYKAEYEDRDGTRRVEVKDFPRLDLGVWSLIREVLNEKVHGVDHTRRGRKTLVGT